MSKAVMVIQILPESCQECRFLYGDGYFCGHADKLFNGIPDDAPIPKVLRDKMRVLWNWKEERAPFCPLIELPGEIKPEDCEVLEIDTDKRFTEDEKELIACGTAHGWNCLLDILTEGRGSNDK